MKWWILALVVVFGLGVFGLYEIGGKSFLEMNDDVNQKTGEQEK